MHTTARTGQAPRRATKAEAKRERAEAARLALLAAQRKERYRRYGLWGAAALILAVTVTVVVLVSRPSNEPTPVTATPAMSTALGRTTAPPWDAPADATAAAAQAGLQMLGMEGNALHIHAHLDVFVDGKAVTLPANIGIDVATHEISALHTHDASGVIHIESPVANAAFSLGQVFTEWQVSMSADHLGSLPVDDTHHLTVYVNGVQRSGDPAAIVLGAHDEIAIVYGTDAEKPTIPTSYTWTNGL